MSPVKSGGTMTAPISTIDAGRPSPPATRTDLQCDVRTTSGVTGDPVPTTTKPGGVRLCATLVETRPTPIDSTQSPKSTPKGCGALVCSAFAPSPWVSACATDDTCVLLADG